MTKIFKRSLVGGLLICALLLLLPGFCWANSYTVCAAGCDYSGIQDAINASLDGDLVQVMAGTYQENINFNGKSITVRGMAGAESCIIYGNGTGNVITSESDGSANIVLDGLSVKNGGECGVYILKTTSTIQNCIITSNNGYGIHYFTTDFDWMDNDPDKLQNIDGTLANIVNCIVSNNTQAGIYHDAASVIDIQNSTISGNFIGIEIEWAPDCLINGSTISGNTHSGGNYGGEGIYINESAIGVLITDCTISSNTGVGIEYMALSPLDIQNCTLKNQNRGGIFVDGAPQVTILDCTIKSNINSGNGGGIRSLAEITTIQGCTISGNTGFNGGGVWLHSWIINTNVSKILNSFIHNNTALNDGGGLYLGGAEGDVLKNCIVSGNYAANNGGGIASQDYIQLLNCSISGNRAQVLGGGILGEGGFYTAASQMEATNCIFLGNMANASFNEIDLRGDLMVTNSVINSAYVACSMGGCTRVYTGTINVDPLFVSPVSASLAPTAEGDYHIQAASPCVDTGIYTEEVPTDDIDGDVRPVNGINDMGADEYYTAADTPENSVFYQDMDSDGYGNPAVSLSAGAQPAGYVLNNTDCNDQSAGIHPQNAEICDGLDNDCDSLTDEELTPPNNDKQAGVCSGSAKTCKGAGGWVNDYSKVVNYQARERSCDSLDNDCDGIVDEYLRTKYYNDGDGDGFGNPENPVLACSAPAGYASKRGDCDDTRATVYPRAEELCDGLDNDCDGKNDENSCNVPPDCSAAIASAPTLLNPDHSMADIRILGVTDANNDPITIVINSITQDEPVRGGGGCDYSPDGVKRHTAQIRAERMDNGNGRVYKINFTAYDDKNAASSGSVKVYVPRNQTCIDDGQKYNSLLRR